MKHIVVAAGIESRLRSAEKVCNEVERRGHKVSLHIDSELVGATRAWCEAIDAYTSDLNEMDHIVVLPDDCELSDHYDPGAFAERMVHWAIVGDMQANHTRSKDAFEAGYGYYTTSDGITAFGLIGRKWVMRGIAELAESFDGKIQFDEAANIFAQLRGSKILKPTMSMVEHTLEHPSLQGNDGQPVGMRRAPHFDPSKPLPSDHIIHLGRTYKTNHWRFLWTMGAECRQETGYVVAAYDVNRDKHVEGALPPPRDTLPEWSTGKAT